MKREEIRKITIAPQTTLKSAMKALSAISGRVLFVIDEKEALVGSVTDGDIRRAILNGLEFDSPISQIMFKNPRYVVRDKRNFREAAKRYIIDDKLHTVPVLDKARRIVDLLFWYDFFEKHPHEAAKFKEISNPVVIMAGGKGERLDPFTKILPKPLIPFGDKPIIEKIMDNFNKDGFVNFLVALNYKKDLIKMYFRENKFPYRIKWVEENECLGTAGALGLLKGKIKETFFVSNCDVILENDFKSILLWHKGEKALLTLIGCHKEMVVPYGTLDVNDGRLTAISEKPTYDMIINTGIYVMEPEVLELIPKGRRIDMDGLIERVMRRGKISVYPVCDGWHDLGQWKEYKDSLYLLQNGK